MTKKMSKTDKLKAVIRSRPKALVAFSGGVDSTLLLKVCRDVLGPANVTAVTGVSQTYTPEEKATARRVARGLGVRHVLIETDELACAAFAVNPADRCYHCKKELFGKIADLARTLGVDADSRRNPGRAAPLVMSCGPAASAGVTTGRRGCRGRPPPERPGRPR